MTEAVPIDSGADALASLEERVHRTVELIATLRHERDQARADAARLRAELEALRGERTHVRTRIEKLLAQLDLS